MSVPSPIDRYIAQVRLDCPERIQQDSYNYLSGSIFKSFTAHFDLKTSLKVVYTPSRRAERVKINGQSWLIYDQYLGQTLNLLNRIFVEAQDGLPAIVYFHKFVAERALEHGMPLQGVCFSNFYAGKRDALQHKGVDDLRRGLLTVTGEKLAIFHELGHELLESGHDFVGFFKLIVCEAIASKRRFHEGQTAETLEALYRTGDPAAYHDAPLEEVIAGLQAEFDSEAGLRQRQAYSRALNDPDTARELFCDFVGCEFALMSADQQSPSLADTIRALYVSSYHLKALAFADWFLEQLLVRRTSHSEIDFREAHRMQAIQVRSHCLREHLLLIYRTRLRAEGMAEADVERLSSDLSLAFMRDQKQHYDVIMDPMFRVLEYTSEPGRLDELAAETLEDMTRAEDIEEMSPEDAALFRQGCAAIAVLKQTNWPMSLVTRVGRSLLTPASG